VLIAHALVAGGAASVLAGILGRGLGRIGFLDHPNARSSHQRATPRGGGLAFIASSALLMPSPLLLIPVPLALVGLLDDRRGLPVHLRLLVQLLTGVALALEAGWPPALALLAAVPAAAVINAINFMDGLDGLVASCMALWLLMAGLLLQQGELVVLAAALLGFLIWNWSPARLFMGDVGSTYLGAVMAGVLLQASRSQTTHLLPGLLLTALPLLGDAFSCLLRRHLAGQRLWQAHRLHLYQRLKQAGWSHPRIASVYALATGGLAGLTGLSRQLQPTACWAVVLGATLAIAGLGWWLDRSRALPFEKKVEPS